VELASINFHDFDSVDGDDDFNLTVDGVTKLMDHHSGKTSEHVESDNGDNGDNVFDFQNVSGTEFLFWLDDHEDDWRVDDITIAADGEEIKYNFGGDTGYQSSMSYSESGVDMVVTAHEVVNDNMGGTSGGDNEIFEVRDAPVNGLFTMEGDGTLDFDPLDLDITAGLVDSEEAGESDEPHGVFAFPDGSSARGETTPGSLIWVADDPRERVYSVDSDGALVDIIETKSIHQQFDEPEGIEIDPISGNLLIADDSGGLSRVFELTLQGALVQSFDMEALTSELGAGFDDPEGLFVREAGGTTRIVGFDDDDFGHLLLVAFDSDEAIGIFSIVQGAAGSSSIPEPGTLALLFAAMAGTLLVPRRHRSRRA